MTSPRDMLDNCACHKIRVAARLVTGAYNEALRPVGLRATQVSLLAAVAVNGAMSITALAREVGMDRTTLTRNLAPLEKEGLLAVGDEGWRRSRTLRITEAGLAKLQQATPLWETAQDRLRQKLGPSPWDEVHTSLQQLINAA